MSAPERTCIGCRTKGDKSSFVRIVMTPEGTVSIDRNMVMEGRGAYICRDVTCVSKVRKKNAIARALKHNCRIPEEFYSDLEGYIDEQT